MADRPHLDIHSHLADLARVIMKAQIFALAFVVCLVAAAVAMPAPEEPEQHLRVRRASCQVLGVVGCSANCFRLGRKKGGYCNKNKICICYK
ncbi:Phormicin [Blattella germanica]|nr:Phormicin [Blattella germanica]